MSQAMEGGGHYNANASAQASSARFGLAHLARAAETAPVDAAGMITIVDYGASEGRNSLAPIAVAVAATRRTHGADQPVWVVHTDLPDNDFSSLFRTVADDPGSYRRAGVHTAAIGRSFYEQLLPTGSVGLGWSSIAVHWLGTDPPPLDGFWFTGVDATRYAAWAGAAADDWRAFLTARAAELLPGARLVIVVGSAHGEGRARRSGAERAMTEIARGVDDLVVRGVLTAAERAAMTIPAWYRTTDEWRAPFGSGIGLELEQLDLSDIGDPLWLQTRDRPGDYAATVAGALRVSFGPALLHGLEPTRRAAVAAALFDGHLADAISAQAPEPWFDWRLAVMVIAKPA